MNARSHKIVDNLKPEEEKVSPAELQKQGLRTLAHIIAQAHLRKIRAENPRESQPDDKIMDKAGLI